MTYRILDVEASADPPVVALEPSESGIGVLVRRNGVPAAFFLEELTPGTTLSPTDVGALIDRRSGRDLTRAAIQDELSPDDPVRATLHLTVAICTRDRPQLLRRCLASLAELPAQAGAVEVLVVDNAPSTPAAQDVVGGFPSVRYVREPQPGLDVARNRALDETRTPHIAFVDDDVVVDRAWLSGLSAAWADDPEAGAVTGLVLPYELDTPAQVLFERRGGFRRGMERRRFAAGNGYRSNHPYGTGGFGTGANMAFRTGVLRALGGFDPALDTGRPLPGGGDLDAFFRVLDAGHVLVYAPGAAVWHRHRPDMRGLRRQYWTWGTGYLAFLHRTYRERPDHRRGVLRAAAWWLRRELATSWRSLRGRDPAPPSVAAAPLAGGVLTAAWKYPWSAHRQRARGTR